jgi:hypothetical protein
VRDYALLVAPDSAVPFRPANNQYPPLGSIVLSAGGAGIFSQSHLGNTHVVMLQGEGQTSDDDSEAIAFTEWSLSIESPGTNSVELCSFPPPELL